MGSGAESCTTQKVKVGFELVSVERGRYGGMEGWGAEGGSDTLRGLTGCLSPGRSRVVGGKLAGGRYLGAGTQEVLIRC